MSNINPTVIKTSNNVSDYKRIIFYYDGGEKTILTIMATDRDVQDIAETIASSQNEFVYLEVGSAKKDLILINRTKFIFLMASSISESEVNAALALDKQPTAGIPILLKSEPVITFNDKLVQMPHQNNNKKPSKC